MKHEVFAFVGLVIDAVLAYIDLRSIPASWIGLLVFIGVVSVAFMALTILLDRPE